ncbi:unnamed protein product [Gongylonema pulchrum]|uniref:Hemimethylated DNA-binding domain-containing protein n=1 Tax=Gongylonema pulchrum TaxID=637853 RepID=A0A3P7M5L7_9BILA|nr:unnamed protein product [Gongylonema pulchrum]
MRSSISHWLRLLSFKEEFVDEVVDVPEEEKKKKYFGASLEPRDPRPPYVKYRVGDVVRHKVHGYKGVIIGWDEKAVAPQTWLDKTHKGRKASVHFSPEWSEMPNYSIIIDTRDRLIPQLAYVVEENIELGEGRVRFFVCSEMIHTLETSTAQRYEVSKIVCKLYFWYGRSFQVFHPLIKNYFESFDGKHYAPRPWHRKVYPND